MTALAAELAPLDLHQSFQDFIASRPDEETWELIAGRFIVQAQPNFDHQIIAGNLDRLLTDGIERLGLARVSMQNPAVDLRPALEGHVYVPDVAVLDLAEIEPGRNVASACYLAAEIVSPSDRRRPAGKGSRKIEIKLAGYEALPACEAVLLVEPRAFDATVSERSGAGWSRRRLTGPDARLVLACAGLECRLAELYARTSLARTLARPLARPRDQ
ncbi:Uma2 family endonuclease [Methylobacterium sp. NEAU 140]|uniref:Uma2 family endonuclease n=1 Tax=Methylobacterium sp. NEAU 140 TaxID=3064945 RepID=UPI00273714FE|nr:Uma2 family endonuclease [Methylobacterium sp. NEAU 140]MDP4022926.1 Uma2 family endonuclease [Methylobacterium sp. NEAU 140]